MRKKILLLILLLMFVSLFHVYSQDNNNDEIILEQPGEYEEMEQKPERVVVPPPVDVRAVDFPNDNGKALIVKWDHSPWEEEGKIVLYRIMRSEKSIGPFREIATVPVVENEYVDSTVYPESPFFYKVLAEDLDGNLSRDDIFPAEGKATAQLFHIGRLNILIILAVLSFFIFYSINRAKKDPHAYIRPIAGLAAVEEAIGRATEMGKPTLFISGIMDMDDVQTIAGVTILGQVSKMCAEYDTPILVPTSRAVVMTTSQEVVREAYLKAGRPDAFNQDNIWYMTDDQFGFAAGVDGLILRQKPAAVFLLGRFYAESLILAETGNFVGAIQIAGTAEPSQLPFFVTACDYTLIGEELFAASAYLSRDPMSVGSLKGQDWGKAIIIGILALGFLFSIVSYFGDSLGMPFDILEAFKNLFKVV